MGVPDRFWWLQCSLCHPASAPLLFTQCVRRMAGQLSWLLPGMGMLSYCGNWSSNTDVTRMLWKRCTIISIVHVCVCVHACVRACAWMSVRLCVCTYICVSVCMLIHIYTWTDVRSVCVQCMCTTVHDACSAFHTFVHTCVDVHKAAYFSVCT